MKAEKEEIPQEGKCDVKETAIIVMDFFDQFFDEAIEEWMKGVAEAYIIKIKK